MVIAAEQGCKELSSPLFCELELTKFPFFSNLYTKEMNYELKVHEVHGEK